MTGSTHSKGDLQRDITKIGEQAYKEELNRHVFSADKMSTVVSAVAGCMKNKLEREYTENSFHLYSIVTAEGKLSRHAVHVVMSRAEEDVYGSIYGAAIKANGFDCLTVVIGAKSRTKALPAAVVGKKAKFEEEAQAVIKKEIADKKFNTMSNPKVAATISTEMRSRLDKENLAVSFSVATVILPTDVDYKDTCIGTARKDSLIVQSQFKNEEFNAIVVATFIPLE